MHMQSECALQSAEAGNAGARAHRATLEPYQALHPGC